MAYDGGLSDFSGDSIWLVRGGMTYSDVVGVVGKLTIAGAVLVIPILFLLFMELDGFRSKAAQITLALCLGGAIFLSTGGSLFMLVATRRFVWILSMLPGIATAVIWVQLLMALSAYKR